MTVTLELRGSTVAFGEDLDEDAASLGAETLPLAWLSLLTEADLARPEFWEGSSSDVALSWTDQVRAAFADPDTDGIPPLEVCWPLARARLRSAVVRLHARNDPWAGPVAEWEARLVALAARGPTVRTVLDLGAADPTSGDPEAFLNPVLHGVRWWADPDGAPRPQVASEGALTGGPVGETTVWKPGRAPSPSTVRPRTARERGVDALLVVLLSTVMLLTFYLTGSVLWTGAAFMLVTAGITWGVSRRNGRTAEPEPASSLTLRTAGRPVTVWPAPLPVLVCVLLLLGGLLDLWGQLHRVQGPCCSRAYLNYWPARTWTELWVTGAFVLLGAVSQTVRVRNGRVTVTWLLGLLRLSRPAAKVRVEPVELTAPRTQERTAGLRLRVGWLGVTVAEGQPGYAALRAACTPHEDAAR